MDKCQDCKDTSPMYEEGYVWCRPNNCKVWKESVACNKFDKYGCF